ncbi:hypothetical protein BSR03_13480 [Serratia proteamaculans]|nr:hypothetical protein BSR03_13480 [Serratia proteamaculans]
MIKKPATLGIEKPLNSPKIRNLILTMGMLRNGTQIAYAPSVRVKNNYRSQSWNVGRLNTLSFYLITKKKCSEH